MSSSPKNIVLQRLRTLFGDVKRLSNSQSLYVVGDDALRIYLRYSKLHRNGNAFYGLRDVDLRQLEGHISFLTFLTDNAEQEAWFVPFADFEEVFQQQAQVARDGQYKVQIILQKEATELYIPQCGRFNIESYAGLDTIADFASSSRLREAYNFTHSQVQTLLGSIGRIKGYDVYMPAYDVSKLDWNMTEYFPVSAQIPEGFAQSESILREVDVAWVERGRNDVMGLFEVEHSTPVYSGLLRFNDLLLTRPELDRFLVVSNDSRRDLFTRQVRRPTFQRSGLSELVSFLDYANVAAWHKRLRPIVDTQ